MKFAHLADVHLGSWSSHPDLKDYPQLAFEKAADICIAEGVDFVLICGDFFDTSLPSVDTLKFAAEILRKIKDNNISIYAIAGSHDFSPTGKTMLSVLESAGLLKLVSKGEIIDGKIKLKFTVDEKTGAAITGIIGRRLGLEKSYYENMICDLPDGFKIFLFHSALEEYKPQYLKDMHALPISLLPKGFDYYAAGHVHKKFSDENIHYPGSLFPTSFDEFLGDNGFYIFDSERGLICKNVKIRDAVCIEISADDITAKQLENKIFENLENNDINEKILLLRIEGILNGSASDIDFTAIEKKAKALGACIVKRNTGKLKSKEFEEIKLSRLSAKEIEESLIEEHLGKINFAGDEHKTILDLMNVLNDQKQEGETAATFKERVMKNAKIILAL